MVEIQETEMSEEDIIERKLLLEGIKIKKDESDINLKEKEEQLDSKAPNRLIDDDIEALKEDLQKGTVKDKFGNEIDATEIDKEIMQLSIKKLGKIKELDIPMRKLRFEINSLRASKKRLDAPENQIHKLEKEIRNKRISSVAQKRPMPGIN